MESERDEKCREFLFDLLFSSTTPLSVDSKSYLILLISYSVSLVAKNTLDAVSRWILLNVNNNVVDNLFHSLIKDQFMLRLGKPQNLINLAHASPLFASIFISIVIERLASHLTTSNSLNLPLVDCLGQVLELFDAWFTFNPGLPLIAIKQSLNARLNSNRLNIVDNLVRIAFIYPLRMESSGQSGNLKANQFFISSSLVFLDLLTEEYTERSHLFCMKLLLGLRDLSITGELNILDMKTLETLLKRLDELEANRGRENDQIWLKLRSESLERLVECLELCWKYRMSQVNKKEAKVLLHSYLAISKGDLGQVANLLLAE